MGKIFSFCDMEYIRWGCGCCGKYDGRARLFGIGVGRAIEGL